MERTEKFIENFKEKRLLVVRHILRNELEPTDENIMAAWCTITLSDKDKVNAELLEWIRKHIKFNNTKSCDEQLYKIRCKQLRNLKEKCEYVGYGAKLVRQPKTALATYNIFTKGKKFSGSYSGLCRRIGRLPKINK